MPDGQQSAYLSAQWHYRSIIDFGHQALAALKQAG